MSHDELCLVRPGEQETGEGQGAGEDHQDRAYRRAWDSFNLDAEEEDNIKIGNDREGSSREGSMEEEGGEEGQRSKAVAVPEVPTARAWGELMVSRWHFRNWCEHCVRGKAKAGPHRTTTRKYTINYWNK